jgi:hypothetical protein
MAVTFGLASTAFDSFYRMTGQDREPTSSYSLSKHDGESAPAGFRRRGAVIENRHLADRLRKEKISRERAAGESLPDAK